MNDNASHPTTPLPCPSWCGDSPGHHFESEDKAGVLFRYHVTDLRRVPVAARSRETGIGWINGEATVSLAAEETAAGVRGPVLDAGPVVVNLYGLEEGDDLTGPEARALAAALLNAADEWDRITGASS